MNRLIIALILALLPIGAWAQSCAVTSPTSGQVILTAETLPLTLTLAGTPTAYRAVWSLDGNTYAQTFNADQHQVSVDPSEAWTGVPFQATLFTGLIGDSVTHVASAVVYDLPGTQLASNTVLSIQAQQVW